MFEQHQSFTSARIGRAMSLQRAHIDPATMVLTFVYQELVDQGETWVTEERQQVLVEGTHYSLNKQQGTVTLLNDPFWSQEGLWRACDRSEPLLYKGMVKHPQRIDFDYEHFRPQGVVVKKWLTYPECLGTPEGESSSRKVSMHDIDTDAQAGLGYEVRKYQQTGGPNQ